MRTTSFKLSKSVAEQVFLSRELRDPVCGLFLDRGPLQFTYAGRSIPFCGFFCLSLFRENPDRFLRRAAHSRGKHNAGIAAAAPPV